MTIPQDAESWDGMPAVGGRAVYAEQEARSGVVATVVAVIMAILGLPCLWNAFLVEGDGLMWFNAFFSMIGVLFGYLGVQGPRLRVLAILAFAINCICCVIAVMCTILSLYSRSLR